MNNAMATKFNALNKRERMLVSITSAVIVVMLFFVAAIEPLMKKSSRLDSQVEQKERRMNAYSVEATAFTQALAVDPSVSVKEEVASLEKSDKHVTALLQQRSVHLMDPVQMSQVLETVLQDNQGITLKRLASLPLKPLELSEEADSSVDDVEVAPAAAVYSHGFEVVLQGRYSDIYDYLRRLEGLSSSFFWDSLEYEVSTYPNSEVTLQVHTLSAVEGWLGG
ncbi:type II secretion system protein M [Neptunomonas japonica]|uniref:type II secretion system protein M n=1 Tax=Neptunomonas japonica TaxID=417574 RepID=UPI0004268E13|nr:type II secretion system protein M [Neptunomonas japonica]